MDPSLAPETVGDAFDQDLEEQSLDFQKLLRTPVSDYYGLLSIPKTANLEEIEAAYKNACASLHPNNYSEQELKDLAQVRFEAVQRAYDVLVSVEKRPIYDQYGEKGLNSTGEVGPRIKTPKEMEEEYERMIQRIHEKELENIVNTKSQINLGLDMSSVFDPYFTRYNEPGLMSRLSKCGISQLELKHSIQTNLSDKTVAILRGNMNTRKGMGGGNILGTVRHTFNPHLWAEFTTSLFDPKFVGAKVFHTLSANSFLVGETYTGTWRAPPVVRLTAGRRIGEETTGYVKFKSGQYSIGPWGEYYGNVFDFEQEFSTAAVGMSRQNRNSKCSVEFQAGAGMSRISFSYIRKLNAATNVRAALNCTTNGIIAAIGGDTKVSEHNRVGLAVESGDSNGVTLKLRLSRLGQRLSLPIMLTPEFDLSFTLWAIAAPSVSFYLLDRLWLSPRRKRLAIEKIETLRSHHNEYLEERKKEAVDAMRLMKEAVGRKQQQEDSKNGLVITQALYGNFEESRTIDVTIAVQALVNNSQLIIAGGHSKSNIIGFYDPCFGSRKQLNISYKFQGQEHQVTIGDTSPLACPIREHMRGPHY
ncbi:DnaJ-domain-containing protein [Basidiobolus meristosporus CBS 931.73]|uniref:DnaJ-domain-containing protein n=1 Tax=Basidiobolus meristosporus CBS 931.73 TaxID=1314790 RepID=A0A1Y1Y170_9FUNG|nr:DnaJ-domain-containing protein [Basidiobolus meristosporus CBS 931.73]|eukprot:ORX91718.1 DnaJ-domain-containing protein [Basidiobolus meristosporus CBS 931.73]